MWHWHEFSFTVISGTLIKINFSAWFDYDTTSVFALSFIMFTFFSCIYIFDCYHLECWCQHTSLLHTDSYSLAKWQNMHCIYISFSCEKDLLIFLYSDIFNFLNKGQKKRQKKRWFLIKTKERKERSELSLPSCSSVFFGVCFWRVVWRLSKKGDLLPFWPAHEKG